MQGSIPRSFAEIPKSDIWKSAVNKGHSMLEGHSAHSRDILRNRLRGIISRIYRNCGGWGAMPFVSVCAIQVGIICRVEDYLEPGNGKSLGSQELRW